MGWGRTLLLGDIGNRLDIEDTERDIASLKQEIAGSFRKDMSQDEKIGRLITENAQLKLGFASLVRLLIRKGSISKDELAAVVAAVDAEDGSVDGQFTGKLSNLAQPRTAASRSGCHLRASWPPSLGLGR